MTPMEAVIRIATLDDLEAILLLDRDSPVGHTREALLTARTQAGETLVAELNKRMSGFLVLHEGAFFDRDFVDLLVVDLRNRGQGIGAALLGEAVTHSSTGRIFASTNESNTAMLNLLVKEGWEISGRLDGIDDGDPEIVYYKDARRSNE